MKNGKYVIGGLIGDIAGSVYEFDNYRAKDFVMFGDYHGEKCFATDDSIMTLSICKALLETKPKYDGLKEAAVRCMQEVGRPYPGCGYGGGFLRWMYTDNPEPYTSFGNGAAMRVSPVAYAASTLIEAEKLAEMVTVVSHDHTEGIKGGRVTAGLVYMALHGFSKDEMKEYAAQFYDLDFTIDGIRDSYVFNETCQGTVPQAIVAFLESKDFEDAIRTAISVGGDSDTLACITGSIAGPFYGVPEDLQKRAEGFLDERLLPIYQAFAKAF